MANFANVSSNVVFTSCMSRDQILDVLKKDATRVSTKVAKYSKVNYEQYTCAINTWVALCADLRGPRCARFLRNCIIDKGLLSVIDEASKAANKFIASGAITDGDTYLYPLYGEDGAETLQLLRYLKRFSPGEADLIRKAALDAFLTLNNSIDKGEAVVISDTGTVIKREYRKHPWLVSCVRKYCTYLLGKAPDSDELFHNAHFSNGVTAEGCRTLNDKVIAFGTVQPYYGGIMYPLTSMAKDQLDFVKVVAVPKSYKTSRIIAEVPAYQQFWMQGIRECAVKATQRTKYGPLIIQDDQRVNQEWARLGSIYGTFATLDLSAASDSIGDALAHAILPDDWLALLDKVNPKTMLVNNRRVKRHIFQTSGNGTTFIFESIIFLAIALAATEYYSLFAEPAELPRTFGDDLIVDVRVYETIVDFLTTLGFKVNLDKSFSQGFYRESCGSEWYCGLDMSSKYWPRKEILIQRELRSSNPAEALQSLISVQHRLFGYDGVNAYLTDYIRDVAVRIYGLPEMTSSLPGSDCDDLWEDYPLFVRKRAPHGGALSAVPVADLPEYLTRERHMVLHSKYPNVSGYYPQVDMYNYVNFLVHGPRYLTATDEILHVSAGSQANTVSAHVAELQWGYAWT